MLATGALHMRTSYGALISFAALPVARTESPLRIQGSSGSLGILSLPLASILPPPAWPWPYDFLPFPLRIGGGGGTMVAVLALSSVYMSIPVAAEVEVSGIGSPWDGLHLLFWSYMGFWVGSGFMLYSHASYWNVRNSSVWFRKPFVTGDVEGQYEQHYYPLPPSATCRVRWAGSTWP